MLSRHERCDRHRAERSGDPLHDHHRRVGVFTAGNDLEDFLKDGTSNTDMPRASNATKFLYSLAHNAKPIIAAVDGVAIGIGTTMLFHCDYVLASKTATFSTPFIHLGWSRKAPPAC